MKKKLLEVQHIFSWKEFFGLRFWNSKIII